MSRTVMLDELHLTFRIPAALPAQQVKAIRRVLNSKRFTAALRRAVLNVMTTHGELKLVRVTHTR